MVTLIVYPSFVLQYIVYILYLVHALLVLSIVIVVLTLLLSLKNEHGHAESKAVVATDLGWNPTTYKVLPY